MNEVDRAIREIENNPYYPSKDWGETVHSDLEYDSSGNAISEELLWSESGNIDIDSQDNYTIDIETKALLTLIDKYSIIGGEDGAMSRSKIAIGYTAIPKELLKQYIAEEKVKLKHSMFTERGILGNGWYFSENNFSYARYIASKAKTELVIIGAVLDLKNCVDLLTSKGQNTINTLYKKLTMEGINIDSDNKLFEQLKRCSRVKIDSAKSFNYIGKELYTGSKINKHMSNIICIYNSKCVIKFFNPYKKESIPKLITKIKR